MNEMNDQMIINDVKILQVQSQSLDTLFLFIAMYFPLYIINIFCDS